MTYNNEINIALLSRGGGGGHVTVMLAKSVRRPSIVTPSLRPARNSYLEETMFEIFTFNFLCDAEVQEKVNNMP